MTFPVYIPLGPWHIHPHALFDLLAYTAGGQLYWYLRGRQKRAGVSAGAGVPFEKLMWVFVFMAGGALWGAKVLAWLEMWPEFWAQRFGLGIWLGGKTILGGILGGWIGVETGKKAVGLKESTGDAFVFPLIMAIAVGRIGCFLTGLTDHTYGIASSLPWTIDLGDGIRRHPTSLYEMVFLVALGVALVRTWRGRSERSAVAQSSATAVPRPSPAAQAISAATTFRPPAQQPKTAAGTAAEDRCATMLPNGALFRAFVAAYCTFRLLVEFLKPREVILGGLCPIQWTALAGALAALVSLRRTLTRQEAAPVPAAEEVAP